MKSRMLLFTSQVALFVNEEEEEEEELLRDTNKRARVRRVYPRPDYTQSVWWRMMALGNCKIDGHRENKLFRRRFGVKWSRFVLIVEAARTWRDEKGKLLFAASSDVAGRESVPLELQILGACRINAKGCSFDAIAELAGMHLSTMQAFYHKYCKRFVKEYRDIWIFYPRTVADAAGQLTVMERLGSPGAYRSFDCTHLAWGRCPVGYGPSYVGKEKFASISYQLSCDHNHRFQSVR